MASSIFISYRRLDSKSDARSICQRLEKTFGKGKIFIDVDSISPGENFRLVLNRYLKKCNIMIVVIGPRWLELQRRSRSTDSEVIHDYVFLEVASALERKLPIFPVLVDGATMPEANDLPDALKPLAFTQAYSVRHDSFPRDMFELEQKLRRFISSGAGKVVVICGLLIISISAISYYIWWLPLASSKTYSKAGNFACFNEAKYPLSWQDEASFCVQFGCNFGKMSEDACLTLGAKKGSKTVIHGNPGTTRANECWLQHSCGDLRPHSEFTLFNEVPAAPNSSP